MGQVRKTLESVGRKGAGRRGRWGGGIKAEKLPSWKAGGSHHRNEGKRTKAKGTEEAILVLGNVNMLQ